MRFALIYVDMFFGDSSFRAAGVSPAASAAAATADVAVTLRLGIAVATTARGCVAPALRLYAA